MSLAIVPLGRCVIRRFGVPEHESTQPRPHFSLRSVIEDELNRPGRKEPLCVLFSSHPGCTFHIFVRVDAERPQRDALLPLARTSQNILPYYAYISINLSRTTDESWLCRVPIKF